MKKINNHLVLALILALLLVSFPNFTDQVKAIPWGDFYLCNFNDYAEGTTYINETIGGTQWLSIEPKNNVNGVTGGGADKVWQYIKTDQVKNVGAWFNLSKDTVFFSYWGEFATSNFPEWDFNVYFRRADDTQICGILVRDGNAGDGFIRIYATDEFGNNEADNLGDEIEHSTNAFFNVTLNLTTSEVNINISSGGPGIDVWFPCSTFDYVSSIYMFHEMLTGNALTKVQIDDFMILGDIDLPPHLWETGYDSKGCVACDYDGTITNSFASTTTVVYETDRKNFELGRNISQVALAVHSDTPIQNMASWLRIGDGYLENRTRYYVYSDLYILVWEDMDVPIYDPDVPFEFKFICLDTTKSLKIVHIDADIDGDGDRFLKYTLDDSNFNGEYDGDILLNNDLCYQFWYGYGAAFGDMTVNVYNESNTSESLINWSISIVNKITGYVEYHAENQTNPLVIVAGEYGLGERLILIECENFSSRWYYVDVENFYNYTLDAYLPWIDESHLYVIQVLDNATGNPIHDAEIQITKFIGESAKEISSGFTTSYGTFFVYLLPDGQYYINISKSGYENLSVQSLVPDVDKYGIEYPIIYYLNPEEDDDVEIPDIKMDILVLSAYNLTHMQIYYLNLNEDNEFVRFVVSDFIGNQALGSYNISDGPNEITLYFDWSAESLEGDILKVVADAYRTNGTLYTTIEYFNIHQKPPGTGGAAIAAIFSIAICLFGLTISHPNKVFGVVGMIIMVIAIAVTAFADQSVWYIHLIQAVEIILLIYIILVFREEGIHAV